MASKREGHALLETLLSAHQPEVFNNRCAVIEAMDWDHLRVFLAVARCGQLLAAGRNLSLNHATVARRLDALEAEMGTPLLERRPTGCSLTPAGERLIPVAERIEFELLGVTDAIRAKETEVSGIVRIGAPDGLGNYFLASELGELVESYPLLTVELVPLPRNFSISRREADLAIVLDRPSAGRLIVSRLIDYTLSVYASRNYLERHGTPRSLGDLSQHSVVTGVEDFTYTLSLDYLVALEKHTQRRFRCASVMGQTEAVSAGAGIGILHDFVAARSDDLVRVLPHVTFRRSYYLLSHPETASIRRVAVLREFVSRRFKEAQAQFLPAFEPSPEHSPEER
ncbi:MAG: LysR family transcriptional regulator [Croceibacterium sp.]